MTNATNLTIKLILWKYMKPAVIIAGIMAFLGAINSFTGFLSNLTKTVESTLGICSTYEIPEKYEILDKFCDILPHKKGETEQAANSNQNNPVQDLRLSFNKVPPQNTNQSPKFKKVNPNTPHSD